MFNHFNHGDFRLARQPKPLATISGGVLERRLDANL